MTMLSIRTLTKLYDGIPVVDDVSLEIPKGKVTSLIGPNGAGKSTVLGIAARLLAAEHGDVLFDGRSIKSWNTRALARRLAVLTQTNTVQMKVTVRELVGFGRFPHSGTRLTDDDRRRVDEAIRYMGLEAFADRFIDEMSGGQRQRAFIAMVLAQDTDVIFLDEPISRFYPIPFVCTGFPQISPLFFPSLSISSPHRTARLPRCICEARDAGRRRWWRRIASASVQCGV